MPSESDFSKIEKKILEFWQKKRVFEKLKKKNQGKKRWSFLDGPITANNPMGVHHAWGRTYKDLFQRYKAMQGFDQRFQNGFDCQGLWIEVEVEKELGFKNKKDIEKYGIDKFVEKCKERAIKYSKIQTEQSIRLGQWMDWKNSYYTMSDENNYAIWNFLKTCWEKNLLYKGRDVVPWCPRCGTAISQHEILTEEYQEITHKSIFIKLPITGEKKKHLLVWTTTPWTLPGNVALAVHPELKYVEVMDEKRDIFILLREKAGLIQGGRIVKEFLGKKLNGLNYQGMFEPSERKVVLWKDVSQEEGTGIVHIAPGCGQEDYQLSRELNLPVINLTNQESRYKPEFGFLSGKLVSEANDLIFNNLKQKNLVFKIEDYAHRYPNCWRCKTELIFRLVDEWYIAMDKTSKTKVNKSLRERLIDIAKRINWIPNFGLERELDWLKNMQDWLISKKRYWGLALPIFECSCGNVKVIGSKEELKKNAVSGWEKFKNRSPHRPWIDEIKIKCPKCGKLASRIPDVGNPWLDAGIVPFSTMPKNWFPADLICESFPGQFKNWFYSLIVMSAVLKEEEPMRTVFGHALVKDEKGEEMHKSKGNAIWFDEAVEKIGADIMRWMYLLQNPVFNLNFGYRKAEEIKKSFFRALWNSYLFYQTYALENKDNRKKEANLLDKWLFSKFNQLVQTVTENLDSLKPNLAAQAINSFVLDDLSNWYIRRSRKRNSSYFYKTVAGILLDSSKLIAPFAPFIAEEIYQGLKSKASPSGKIGRRQSVHLEDWPKCEQKLINRELNQKMELIRKICELGLSARAKAGIKVRQPLNELRIQNLELKNKELINLIAEELNIKKVTEAGKLMKLSKKWVIKEEDKLKIVLDTEITPSLREEGIVREIVRHIQELRKKTNLKPYDSASIFWQTTDQNLLDIMKKYSKKIGDETRSKELKRIIRISGLEEVRGKTVKIEEKRLWIKIDKNPKS